MALAQAVRVRGPQQSAPGWRFRQRSWRCVRWSLVAAAPMGAEESPGLGKRRSLPCPLAW